MSSGLTPEEREFFTGAKAVCMKILAECKAYDIARTDQEIVIWKLCAIIDRLLSGATTPDGGRDVWQPIETAPKTGSDLIEKCVLGYCAHEEHQNDRFKVVWWEPLMKAGHGCWYSDQDIPCSPTHWQRLPPPPKGDSA